MKILVAEDDFTSRMMLDGILKKWGFGTVLVANGYEAWEIMRTIEAPPIAILDWEMPEMSGLEVCRNLSLLDRPSPPYLILLTAKGGKGDIVKGLDAGANDYILKPYDQEELLARIRVGQRMVQLQFELLELNQKLLFESMHDHLTGIFNRRAIVRALEKEMARSFRENRTLSIGLCDIDLFKNINDTHGHHIGDAVLCKFVRLVQQEFREYDHIGRYGGEEFLILMPGSKGTREEGIYDRICKRIHKSPIHTSKGDLTITVSIGVIGFTGNETLHELLTGADTQLYAAKKNGRNQACYAG